MDFGIADTFMVSGVDLVSEFLDDLIATR